MACRKTIQSRGARGNVHAARRHAPDAGQASATWRASGLVIAGLIVGVLGTGLIAEGIAGHSDERADSPTESAVAQSSADLTVYDMLEMSDEELERLDPLVMNLIVLRGVPGHEVLDFIPYINTVDQWAAMIGTGLQRGESVLRAGHEQDLLYDHDPDLWKAGGMAIALAGPRIGLTYTDETLDPRNVDQIFVAGLIDSKEGTCATMPVLYLAIAHRLHWPLKAVVSRDHMWCRWDDSEKQFNLEATTVTSDGSQGSFVSLPDEEYMRKLNTPPIAVACRSDLVSLSRRQLLGIFLESRAAYWAAQERFGRAEHDLMLARVCYPANRETFTFLHRMMALRAGTLFEYEECLAQSRRYPFIARDGRRLARERAAAAESNPNESLDAEPRSEL